MGGTVIEAIPSVGLVSTIAATYMLTNLPVDQVCALDSEDFPPLSMVYKYRPKFPVRIYADPAVTRNTHEVHARGWFGELTFTIQNVPTENPKTGRITALSVLKSLRDYRASTRLVG